MTPRVILIGIDGFDPALAEELMNTGDLPGFSKASSRGGWSRLQTTNPALSPTAWSSIATGCNPGHHGLFDFITRDAGSYLPKLTVNRPNPKNYFGQRSAAFLAARQGKAFWELSTKAKIPTTIVKWPVSFPAEPVAGNMLSGLGVPDIRGTAGRYIFYTTDRTIIAEKSRGDVLLLPSGTTRMETVLIGPDGITLPMIIRLTSTSQVFIELQGNSYTAQVQKWSPWIPVTFRRFGYPNIRGIFRFYLKSIEPHFQLYVGAIHMDPADPPFPISSPASYSSELAKSLGAFHTLGLPEETNGLVDGLIPEEAFVSHANDLLKEREALFEFEWSRFHEGLFSFVFDTLDRVQHVMWSGLEGLSTQDPIVSSRMNIVKDHYRKLDRIIDRLFKDLKDGDLLIIVSDHGFSTFENSLHLNSWLRDQGLLVLREGKEGLPLFQNVNWQKTKAYALGFVSLYINLAGREAEGIVPKSEADALKHRLAKELCDWRNPLSGERVLHSVYDANKLYTGPQAPFAPDLVIAPKAGYRTSWQTGYGAAPLPSIEKNDRAWRADHIVEPSLVPGFLSVNKPLQVSQPSVLDIAPTILEALGLPPGEAMEGHGLI